MTQDQQPAAMQTLVVHREQLTAENLVRLGEAGYSILTDPALLIFGRPAPQDALDAAAPAASANGHGAVGDDVPILPPHG